MSRSSSASTVSARATSTRLLSLGSYVHLALCYLTLATLSRGPWRILEASAVEGSEDHFGPFELDHEALKGQSTSHSSRRALPSSMASQHSRQMKVHARGLCSSRRQITRSSGSSGRSWR